MRVIYKNGCLEQDWKTPLHTCADNGLNKFCAVIVHYVVLERLVKYKNGDV